MTDPNESTTPSKAYYNENTGNISIYGGLTKREYFAAMAMQGFCSLDEYSKTSADHIAQWAVEQADALIEALNKGER